MPVMKYLIFGGAVWGSIYTASLALGLWRMGNRRGAVLGGLFALTVLLIPSWVQLFLTSQ